MGNNIIKLDFEGNKIRTITKDDSVWFVAADVCKVLGLSNITEALRRLYENEKNNIRNSEVKVGNPNITIISESGLYKLILRSTKPEAVRFQDWVTQDVLPTIRQTGGYINFGDGRDPVQIAEGLLQLAKEQKLIISQQQKEINTMKPVINFVDDFFKEDVNDINFNTMAKLSKFINPITGRCIGGKHLKDMCISQGIINKKDRTPNQLYINKGYFRVIYSQKWFEGCFNKLATSLITPKGQRWLYNRLSIVLSGAA